MKERIVIVFIATLLGLLLTTAGYFIYQTATSYSQKTSADNSPINLQAQNDNAEKERQEEALSISSPTDEAVVDKRTLEITGKTYAENTVVISSNNEDVVGTPARDGNFSITITIDAGVNKIVTRSISPDGEEIVDERIVTYSTEEF